MGVSRRDFVAVAAAIVDERATFGLCDEGTRLMTRIALDGVALKLAAVFAASNPAFDRARFLSAAGVDGSVPYLPLDARFDVTAKVSS